jgi:hypothetical protein
MDCLQGSRASRVAIHNLYCDNGQNFHTKPLLAWELPSQLFFPIGIMDMDIDDILADFDRDNTNNDAEDLRSLTRLWVAERVSPELMPWPEDLIKRVIDRTSKQVLAYKGAFEAFSHRLTCSTDRIC